MHQSTSPTRILQRLAAVQLRSTADDLAASVARHLLLATRAADAGSDIVLFPELSLTGYAPTQAQRLALAADDARLQPLQRFADARGTILVAGAPLRSAARPQIGLLVFTPGAAVSTYRKHHLHADELPFFTPGTAPGHLLSAAPKAALAICYELSVPQHAAHAAARGAEVYLASVAKSATGVAAARARLEQLAREHDWCVLMANCIGPAEGFDGAGGSAAWAPGGACLATLATDREGILVCDIASRRVEALQEP